MSFVITETDIIDRTFLLEDETLRPTWINTGMARFISLCNQYNIDYASIPSTNTPYVPIRVAVVCTLINYCTDMLGSNYKQINDTDAIDVYGSKRKILLDEMETLLNVFTPANCGIVIDETTNPYGNLSRSCFRWERG